MSLIHSVDTNAFLALEDLFRQPDRTKNSQASQVACALIEVLINAKTVNLMIGTDEKNDLGAPVIEAGRTADSFEAVKSAFPESIHVQPFANDRNLDADPDLVNNYVKEFVGRYDADLDGFRNRVNEWIHSDAQSPIKKFDQLWEEQKMLFTMSRSTLENSPCYQEFCRRPPIGEPRDWAKCIDFTLKFRNYFSNASRGVFTGHILRSIDGIQLLADSRGVELEALRVSPIPLNVSLNWDIAQSIVKGELSSWQDLIERVCAIRHEFIALELDNVSSTSRSSRESAREEVRVILTKHLPLELLPYEFKIPKRDLTGKVLETSLLPVAAGLGAVASQSPESLEQLSNVFEMILESGTSFLVATGATVAVVAGARNLLVRVGNHYYSPTGLGLGAVVNSRIQKLINTNSKQFVFGKESENLVGVYSSEQASQELIELSLRHQQ